MRTVNTAGEKGAFRDARQGAEIALTVAVVLLLVLLWLIPNTLRTWGS